MTVSFMESPIFLLMDLSSLFSWFWNYGLARSLSRTDQTVDLDNSWNLFNGLLICSGITMKQISWTKPFFILPILPSLYPLYIPETVSQYQHVS